MVGRILQFEVHRRMAAAGLNQISLAHAAGINEAAVRNILKGRSNTANYYLIKAVAQVLGCSMTELVDDDDAFSLAPTVWAEELYFSINVEVDGPEPDENSMLSFGAAAFTIGKRLVGKFAANLELRPDANPDPETENWWSSHKRPYEVTRNQAQSPRAAMKAFADHIEEIASDNRRPVFMGYPGAHDIRWVIAYFDRYLRYCPLGISALCLKSLGDGPARQTFVNSHKSPHAKRWFDHTPNTVAALDDAIHKGAMGVDLLRDYCGLSSIEAVRDETG